MVIIIVIRFGQGVLKDVNKVMDYCNKTIKLGSTNVFVTKKIKTCKYYALYSLVLLCFIINIITFYMYICIYSCHYVYIYVYIATISTTSLGHPLYNDLCHVVCR